MSPTSEYSLTAMESMETPSADREEKSRRKDRKVDRSNNNLSKLDVDSLIDAESMKTMDGCLQILAQLHVSEALEESE